MKALEEAKGSTRNRELVFWSSWFLELTQHAGFYKLMEYKKGCECEKDRTEMVTHYKKLFWVTKSED